MSARSSETSIPVLSALWVYMLLPSGLLFVAALITSLLITHYDSLLREECNNRVRAFLFGCVALFYIWTLFHFLVLFGPRWKSAWGKLGGFALFGVLFALWLVNGHLTLKIQVGEECFGSVYHTLIIAQLCCIYAWFGALIAIVVLAGAGGCTAPGDPVFHAPPRGARLTREGSQRIGNAQVRRIDTQQQVTVASADSGQAPPASPLPLVEMLSPDGRPRGALEEADALFQRKSDALVARSEQEEIELGLLERSVIGGRRQTNLNELPSPSDGGHFRVQLDEAHHADDENDDAPSAARRASRKGDERLPLTSRLHR